MRFHMLQNVQMALDFLRYKKVSPTLNNIVVICQEVNMQIEHSQTSSFYMVGTKNIGPVG